MTEHISPEIQQNLREFQEAQQQARIVLSQKYQVELQAKEVQAAIDELEKAGKTEVHKVVGQILIKSDKETVSKELQEKADTLGVRLKSLEAQEKNLSKNLKALQDRLQGIIPHAPEESDEKKEKKKKETEESD
ncbi:MAG: prefoldin subunit beta [archaeon]